MHSVHRSVLGVALVTALILLLPLVAMQITDEVAWSPADFAVAGALVFGTGLAYELVARRMDDLAYRLAIGVALAAALILVWLNLAVGIIGTEGDPANLMYVGVLVVGIVGAVVARLRPQGMARALLATAVAQALVASVALLAGLGSPWDGPMKILALNGFFIALFVGSAWMFRRAAHRQVQHRASLV